MKAKTCDICSKTGKMGLPTLPTRENWLLSASATSSEVSSGSSWKSSAQREQVLFDVLNPTWPNVIICSKVGWFSTSCSAQVSASSQVIAACGASPEWRTWLTWLPVSEMHRLLTLVNIRTVTVRFFSDVVRAVLLYSPCRRITSRLLPRSTHRPPLRKCQVKTRGVWMKSAKSFPS